MLDAVILSDIHLGSDNCQAKSLCRFLESIENDEVRTARLILNGQASHYMHAVRELLGVEPASFVFDVLCKPDLRPTQIPSLDADGLKVVVDANGAPGSVVPKPTPLPCPSFETGPSQPSLSVTNLKPLKRSASSAR